MNDLERPADVDDAEIDDAEIDDADEDADIDEEPVPESDETQWSGFEEDDEDENGEEDDEEADELEEPRAEEEPRAAADRDDGDLHEGVGRAAAVLKYIVERIVDEPDQISIGAAAGDRGPVLLLRVAEDDRGKVIGRQGRIVQAIRTIVKAATVGTGEKVSVEIID